MADTDRSFDETCLALWLAAIHAYPEWLTRRELAALIDRKKTPTTISAIECLHHEGWLKRERRKTKRGTPVLVYQPDEVTMTAWIHEHGDSKWQAFGDLT